MTRSASLLLAANIATVYKVCDAPVLACVAGGWQVVDQSGTPLGGVSRTPLLAWVSAAERVEAKRETT
jgi:hypothetical protein